MIGIDEVGRGCWAGPLLVVAARLTGDLPAGLTDSKLLSKVRREELFSSLITSFQFGEGWVQPEEIDKHGLAAAMRIGVCRALLALKAEPDEEIIMDGTVNYCPAEFDNVKTIAKADQLESVVSAASIYAKVTRDQHMERAAKFHPYYGFEKHVGYGTALHMSALKVHGVSAIHRRSFKPISGMMKVEI